MATSSFRTVRIVEKPEKPALSKAQKTFNKLIQKISKQREQLADWQNTIPLYQQKYASELAPLLETFNQHRVKLVHLFDQAYPDKTLSKTDKAKIRDIICSLTAELIAENSDEELKTLYNKYSETSFDAEAEEENKAIKSMMESMLGIELGDEVDFTSPEKMFAHVGEQLQKKLAEEEIDRQAYEERRSKRKKSAKQLAKEAQLHTEEQNVSQSIREVFRKLASALHPDKEQDPVECQRKTVLMQKANAAYGNKNLLQLLELQLEVEQIDQAAINAISEDRLKHYNKVLADQSLELQQEMDMVEFSFKARFNFSPDLALSPSVAMTFLQADIRDIQHDITLLEQDLIAFQNVKDLKSWLKSYRVPKKSLMEDGFFSGTDLKDFFK
jgi:hypothetical protein